MNRSRSKPAQGLATETREDAIETLARQACELMTRPERVEASEAERALLAAAAPGEVIHRGQRLALWVWQAPGPTVLLVHGWGSRASQLGSLVESLRAAGLQVAAFDAPGHGDSGGEGSSVVEIGEAVYDVAREIDGPAAVIAHSVGSPAALHAFRQGLRVQVSVHIAGPSSLDRAIRRLGELCGLDGHGIDRFRELMEQRIGMPVTDMEPEALRPGLRHPGLLVHDPEDREIPWSESAILDAAWPGSELMAVHGAGHRRILDSTDAIEAITRFLGARLEWPRPASDEGAGS